MHRFLVAPDKIRGSTIVVDNPRELHHLQHVLRLQVGDPVQCFDGAGTEYTGTIATSRTRQLVVTIEQCVRRDEQSVGIWLLPAISKGDRFDWLIQKATELGVQRISPVLTARTVVRVGAEQGRKKPDRWRRIAQEAAKQSGRSTLPIIDPPQAFEQALPALKRASLLVMPTLAVTTVPLDEVLRRVPSIGDAAVLIGPEGDFSPEEVSQAEGYGARPVSLGPLVLRSETAAVVTVAILQYVFGSSRPQPSGVT